MDIGQLGALLAHQAVTAFRYLTTQFTALIFNPASDFSAPSLFTALCVAMGCVLLARRRGKDQVRLKVMLRAFFPRRLLRSHSTRADLGFLILNVTLAPTIVLAGVLSSPIISRVVHDGLSGAFGSPQPSDMAPWAARGLMTLALFFAYELAYWTNHYVSHRIPVLWEFHKVHHTAEVLSPMTGFRVHPVDSLVFANFLAVFVGVTAGVTTYGLGEHAAQFGVGDANLIFIAFAYLTVHLQHSNFWIPATGPFGRVLMSPAHHQLHHSDDPAHHDRNYGSCLAIWDLMFGTLVIPERRRQRLTFGAGPALPSNHTATGMLFRPFVSALRRPMPTAAQTSETAP